MSWTETLCGLASLFSKQWCYCTVRRHAIICKRSVFGSLKNCTAISLNISCAVLWWQLPFWLQMTPNCLWLLHRCILLSVSDPICMKCELNSLQMWTRDTVWLQTEREKERAREQWYVFNYTWRSEILHPSPPSWMITVGVWNISTERRWCFFNQWKLYF